MTGIYFIAEITDTAVFVTDESGTPLEFITKEEANNWAVENLAFKYYILKVVK